MSKLKTWVVTGSEFPSRFVPVAVVEGTCDDALAVATKHNSAQDGRVYGVSDTEWAEVTILDPDDPNGMPIYEGSVLGIADKLIAGTYTECYNLRNLKERARTYVVTDGGWAAHAMK